MDVELSYGWTLLLGLARVGLVALVSFVVCTRVALPGIRTASSVRERAWGDAVLGASTAVVVALALGVFGMFDAVSLGAVLALALAGGAWLRYRRVWRRTLLRRYARALQALERIAPPPSLVPGPSGARFRIRPPAEAPPADRAPSPTRAWTGAIAVVAVAAVVVRLLPAFAEPAPFTLRYYAGLETLKGLQVGAPTGSEAGWGLPALVLALSEMARVDPSLVLRGAGAVAVGAVCYGVSQSVRFYWGRPSGAFLGAVFVAVGGSLLPLPLDRQVGAEPLLLAAALALPVYPHVATYLATGSRRGVTVAAVGLAATGFVYPAVGALLAVSTGVQIASVVAQVLVRRRVQKQERRGAYRDRVLDRRAAVTALFAGGTAVVWAGYVAVLDRLSVEGSFVFFENARADVGAALAVAIAVGGLLVAAPLVPGREDHLRQSPRPGALIRNGLQTLAFAAVWVATGAGAEGLSGGAAALLLCAVGVGFGLLASEAAAWLGLAHRWAAARWPRLAAVERVPTGVPALAALGVAVAAVGSGWGVPRTGAPVEPAGFVEGYHAVDRTSLPYAWTAVSHLGTGVRVRNRGRFMDYEYFLTTYDPATYDHLGAGAIPTPDLYVFVERGDGPTAIRDELRPPGLRHAARLRSWLRRYAARPDQAGLVSVFYEDAEVTVVRVSRPAPTLLELPPDSALARRAPRPVDPFAER